MTPHQQLIAGIESLLEQARKLPASPPDSAAPKMTRGQMVAKEMLSPAIGTCQQIRDDIAKAIDDERKRIEKFIAGLDRSTHASDVAVFIREGRDYREGM